MKQVSENEFLNFLVDIRSYCSVYASECNKGDGMRFTISSGAKIGVIAAEITGYNSDRKTWFINSEVI